MLDATSMIDATSEAESDFRLPAAYSQGFAHVRVVTLANADDVGPLPVPGEKRNAIDTPLENAIGPIFDNRHSGR